MLRPGRAGRGPDGNDLAAWLGAVHGLATTEPTPITIDGRSGQMLDIALDPSWTGICPKATPDTTPIVVYLNPGASACAVTSASG